MLATPNNMAKLNINIRIKKNIYCLLDTSNKT